MLHFAIGDVSARDLHLIFGPIDGSERIELLDALDAPTMEDLAVSAGVFPSKGQARRAGLCGPVPHGFGVYGTRKRRFFVWAPDGERDAVTLDPAFDHTRAWFGGE